MGTETRELTVDDSPTTFTLTTPEVDDPAPLVVGIADDAQGVESFRESAGLEESLPSSIHASLESTSGDAQSVGMNVVPAIIEDVLTTFCVDLRRVTVVGFGTGAEAAGDAACTAPDLVVGFAMLDGMRAAEGCQLDPSVSVFVAAADDDPGVDTGTALEEIGSSWADLLGAGSDQVDGRDEETLVRTWVGPGDVQVTTVSSIEGGHTWTTADTNDVTEFITNTARRIE